MKRAFYEWGAITTSALTLFCFGYWVVSLSMPRATLEVFFPFGPWRSVQVLAADGTVTINDRYGSKEEIEEVTKYSVVNPPLTSKTRWALPGFLYQHINWGGQLSWSLQFSLLIPAILSAIAAALFIHGYLRVRREALRAFQSTSRHSTTVAAAGS
jgi:hypothetical protein